MRTTTILATALLIMLFTALTMAQCPQLVWSDEFDGTALDLNKWSYQTGDGCAEGICGWGNNELQYYQQENVVVSNGTMKITAKEQRVRQYKYTSGRIRTYGKADFTYGRFEALIKMPYGQGIWPAFWMLSTDEPYGGWPSSGEIDIAELLGQEPDKVYGTIHYGDPWPDNQHTGASYRLNSGTFADGFHELAIEWEPGIIRWYVDDVLYSTKTSSDTDPYQWPFDHNFHFLLNVAVGGNWPGNPDETTVFPQTMEVDYVRVYDGYFPYISGDRVVPYMSTGQVYQIGNPFSGSTFSWSVPAGATIVSGQGTSSITVDWSDTGGAVVCDVSSDCGNEQYVINVYVEPNYIYELTFENFDDPANVTLSSATGTLQEVSNPDPSGVNTSALSGEYARNSNEQYDVLAYTASVINDASVYKTAEKKFYIDIYTSAPVGSEILLQLEDSSLADATNYPTGRHSRYTVSTTVQNQWERLVFSYLDAPDGSTPDTSIDNIILLFAPNTYTGDTYYFDNFDGYQADTGTGGTAPAAPSNLAATAVSSSQIDLTWTDNSADEDGFKLERSTDGSSFTEIATVGSNTTNFSDTGLVASTTYHYRVFAYNAYGSSSVSNTASATTQSSGGGDPTSLHVENIVLGTQDAGKGQKYGTATVTIYDDVGNTVSDATVAGTFSGDFNESASGVTGTDGTVTLVTTASKRGGVAFSFCVDNVTHATLPYNSADNVVTCSNLAKQNAERETPTEFALHQNFPNPFNPVTTIEYSLAKASFVQIIIYDIRGNEVNRVVDEMQAAGYHRIEFQGSNLATGLYFYKIQAGSFTDMKKMILAR